MTEGAAPITYLTGVSNSATRELERTDLGLLVQPDTGQYRQHLADYAAAGWAADNGAFSSARTFSTSRWWAWLETMPTAGCRFATAPDVVGDAVATWERSAPWLPRIRQLGLPAALVAQDGIVPEAVAWDALDVLFLGGTTEFKLGDVARRLTWMAKARGKAVHMGRVNSLRRLRVALGFGCDTADGTFLGYGPKVNLPRLVGWLDTLGREHQEAAVAA